MHVSMLCKNFRLIPSQALNILFALCGITGSLYGMGRKLEHVEQFLTALFVCLLKPPSLSPVRHSVYIAYARVFHSGGGSVRQAT